MTLRVALEAALMCLRQSIACSELVNIALDIGRLTICSQLVCVSAGFAPQKAARGQR